MAPKRIILVSLWIGVALAPRICAMDDRDWLLDASALEPAERRARVGKALSTYSRADCGLLIGALLSDDQEIELLLPRVHRHIRALVRPEDTGFLVRKIESADSPIHQDWIVDLLGLCGEPGLAELRKLREQSDEPRLRIGALRALGDSLLPGALDGIARWTAAAKTAPEREAGREAERRLRWQTGQLKADLYPHVALPMVRLKVGAQGIRAALAKGGSLLLSAHEIAKADRILKQLGVAPPSGGAKEPSSPLVFSVADFHPLLAYPHDFFYTDVAAKCFAGYSWGRWQEGQAAVLRVRGKPGRAAVVIQEGVLGKGRVVFCGIMMRNIGLGAKLGIAERDPWDENLEWFHASRDPSWQLSVYGARESYVSPHVPYAKPFVGKPIKAAIVTPSYGARDPVEISQRVDIQYDHLPFSWARRKGHYWSFEVGRLTPVCWEIIERALASPREVVILAGRSKAGISGPSTWSDLPIAYRHALLHAVYQNGLGLVVVGEAGPHPRMPEAARLAPVNTAFGTFLRAQWGRGRIVCTGRMKRPPQYCTLPGAFHRVTRISMFDYWAGQLVAQIAWAARREPPIEITGSPSVVGNELHIPLKSAAQEKLGGALSVTLRNVYNRVAAQGRVELKLRAGEEASLGVPVDGLYPARFFAEVVARDPSGRSLGWGAFPIWVKGGLAIRDLELDRPLYRPGDEMAMKVVIDGEIPAGLRWETEILDRYGRQCGAAEGTLDPAQPVCRTKVGRPLWRYVYVQVRLVSDGAAVAFFEKPWIVDVPPPARDFPYMAMTTLVSDPPLAQVVPQAGADWGGEDYEVALHLGLRPVANNFGGVGRGNHAHAMNYERNPCLLGPTFHQWRLNTVPKRVPGMKRADVAMVIENDEESLGGEYGFHPASLQEFRKHLKVMYGSLDRLNEVWQTSHEGWSDVMPMRSSQVRGRASLAPMVDLRLFMDTAYLHHCEFDRIICERHGLRDAKVGLSTDYGAFSDGWDMWKASKMLTCLIRQGPQNREKLRSWRRPDMALGRWTGGYYSTSVVTGHLMPWHQLFHGTTVYTTWGTGVGSELSVWRSDGSLSDHSLAAVAELKQIWSGPATLIRRAARVPPQIGIHYSRASQTASAVEWGKAAWPAGSSFENTLEMLGHQFRWISYEELEQGYCDQWPGRCLYLPVSTCLSDLEVAGLRRFVAKGGTLVVDVDAGARDGHGGAPQPSRLADVLGCEWVEAPKQKKGEQRTASLNVDGAPEEVVLRHGYRRIAKLTTGKAHGIVQCGGQEFPAWIVNRFGKGQALTLNFIPGLASGTAASVQALLRAAGVGHEVGVQKDGEEMRGIERFSFQDGPIRYTGLLYFVQIRSGWGVMNLNAEQRKTVTDVAVSLPVKTHLYDVRGRKYLGVTDKVKIDLAPGHAHLFAHLPYKVEAVGIEPLARKGAGSAIRIGLSTVSEGATGAHAVRVQVFDATGRERAEYSGVAYCPRGQGRWEIPLAPNDPAGTWRVVVTDAATGAAAQRSLEVKP